MMNDETTFGNIFSIHNDNNHIISIKCVWEFQKVFFSSVCAAIAEAAAAGAGVAILI